jgi:hypothetical protein
VKKIVKKSSKIIKEKYCRVSLKFEEEFNDIKDNEKHYKFPDGNEILLNKELFICPEILFGPNLIGQEIPGIPTQMHHFIMKSENEIRKDL